MKTLFLNLFVFCTFFSTCISIYACEYDFGEIKILQTLDLTIGNLTVTNNNTKTNYMYVKEKFNGITADKPTNIFITNNTNTAMKNINITILNRIISNEAETRKTTISIYGKVKINDNYELQSYVSGKKTGVNLVYTTQDGDKIIKTVIDAATITVKDVTASTDATASTDSNFSIYQITKITGTNNNTIYEVNEPNNNITINTDILKQKYAYGINTTLTYVLPFAKDTNTAILKWKLANDSEDNYKTLITVKNPKFYGQPTAVFGRNPLAELAKVTNIDENTKITIQAYFSRTVDGIDFYNSHTEEIYFNKAKKGLN